MADTTLDDDVTKPSQTEPGDGPADTNDPDELATSARPDPGDEAIKAGTVNAVKPAGKASAKKASTPTRRKDRIEKFTQVAPNGQICHVERNIDTGESTVVKRTDPAE